MKRIIISTILSLAAAHCALAFDWQSQSNEQLRADMLQYAGEFADFAKGTREGRAVSRFIRRQQRNAQKQPYGWVSETFDLVKALEAKHPPVLDDSSFEAQMRRHILRLLDYPLHCENKAEGVPEIQEEAFAAVSDKCRRTAREQALAWLDTPCPAPGELQVIKVYNMGVILRTSERAVGIDIKWEGDLQGAMKIASAIDIFFLSHPHGDHFSPVFMEALATCGKTAVLPSDVAPDLSWDGKLTLSRDILEPENINSVAVNVVRGHQGTLPNNGYVISFDGWRILLPGENDDPELETAFTAFESPDLILAASWNHLTRIIATAGKMKGYDPERVTLIPEHENELRHTVNHRESYRELLSRTDRLGDRNTTYPRVILMDIGECVILKH